MHRGRLAAAAFLLSGWTAAFGCGSRTAALEDRIGGDSGTSGGGSGGSSGGVSGSSSGGTSGSSSGTAAPDSGACPTGESLCAGACVNEQTDPASCGGCGIACQGTCALGRCRISLATGADATSIAVDARSVYWTMGFGDVVSVALDGGPPTVLASNPPGAGSVAVDGTSVYWIAALLQGASAVMKLPVGGGTPVTLVASSTEIAGIAVDATSVFWTDVFLVSSPHQLSPGRVSRMPKDGGAQQILVDDLPVVPGAVAVDDTSVYWLGSAESPTSFSGVLQKAPLQGGTAVSLATYQASGPGPVIAALPLPVSPGRAARNIYWVTSPPSQGSPPQLPGSLLSVPAAGGSTSTLTMGASGVAVDATTLYWTTADAVMSMPISGGTPITLANVGGLGGGAGIAVDATSVYWIAPDAIMKLTPK